MMYETLSLHSHMSWFLIQGGQQTTKESMLAHLKSLGIDSSANGTVIERAERTKRESGWTLLDSPACASPLSIHKASAFSCDSWKPLASSVPQKPSVEKRKRDEERKQPVENSKPQPSQKEVEAGVSHFPYYIIDCTQCISAGEVTKATKKKKRRSRQEKLPLLNACWNYLVCTHCICGLQKNLKKDNRPEVQ